MARSWVTWGLAAIVLSAVSFAFGNYYADVYRKLLVWIALALGFNFLFGIAGQIAMSNFAFAGIGAYVTVILAFKLGLPIVFAIPIALAVCALLALAVAIPGTRLDGFYLALATLAFAQLFIVVVNEGGDVTGGNGGISNYRLPALFGVPLRGPAYTAVIVLVLLGTLWTLLRLDRSGFGRACRAVRDNPLAAAAMGVDVARTKVMAFAITAVLAGAAGIATAFIDNIVTPNAFGLDNMFMLLFMVVLGGMGSHAGTIIGATILYLAPFVIEPYVGKLHLLLFGFLVVIVMRFQPAGLFGLWERRLRAPATAVPGSN